ncbi:MAG TPA: hypothetical protein VNR64_12950 [Vicinamibacterales bacterium]|nr:hypothetical protein [Vicinamibacterales bacterium]
MRAAPSPSRPRRGRPRKFVAPAHPITITLPDPVVESLRLLDPDIGRAIVRLAQPLLGSQPHPPAELATFGRRSVIVVNPSPSLEKRTGVDLVHLPDGRALISFDQAMTIPELELVIADALEDSRLAAADRTVFESIRDILRDARRSDRVALESRNIIVIESRRQRRGRSARSRV